VIFWFFIITLTASAVMAVLLPLAGSSGHGSDARAHDREVYLDQLSELERERREGRIGADEAEAAHAEIARRLIALESGGENPAEAGDGRFRRRFAAVVALLVLPLVSVVAYNRLGSPHLPPMPLQARMQSPESGQDIRALVARVEKHLADNPEDGRGWEVLGPVYMRLERPRDAVSAFRNAIRLLGANADLETGLGEAVMFSEGGIVTQSARQAFERALRLDPDATKARFYLALAREQEGDLEGAAQSFREIIAGAPADAPWRSFVEEALARVTGGSQPEPTREQVEAAADMSEGDRREMIETMVAGLAERLEKQPANPEGWVRLVRAYMVLKRPDDAQKAAGKALKSLEDPAARKALRSAFESMGVSLEETEIQ
jgi:cytochrome c-type biogenesis protein CcmH